MNIVVVGGGTHGRFGNDFVRQAKSNGHTVKVLSHRTSKDTSVTVNFLNLDETVEKFESIINDLDNIDILLYNTNYKGHPDSENLFTSTATIKEKLYLYGFYVHVLAPHAIIIKSLKKMNSDSKIFFMTTDVIYDRERQENLHKLGYYGGKAYQHQLMLALAECNDKGATVSSISPYFDYDNPMEYYKKFKIVYDHIFNGGTNAKVFDCWE